MQKSPIWLGKVAVDAEKVAVDSEKLTISLIKAAVDIGCLSLEDARGLPNLEKMKKVHVTPQYARVTPNRD